MIKFKNLVFAIIFLLIAGFLGLIGWEYAASLESKPWAAQLVDPGKEIFSGSEYPVSWTFAGSKVPGVNYKLQRATDPTYTKDVVEYGPLAETSLGVIAPPLSRDTTFYYRVNAGYKIWRFDVYLWIGWSDTVDIIVKHIPAPALSIKGNLKSISSRKKYTLKWAGSAKATRYTLEQSTDPSFQDLTQRSWSKEISKTAFTLSAPEVSENSNFYYRVRASQDKGPISLWSPVVGISIKTKRSLASGRKSEGKVVTTAASVNETKSQLSTQKRSAALTDKQTSARQKGHQDVTGHWVAQHVFDRERGKSSLSEATMVLVNKNQDKKTRTFTHRRRLENGLENQLIRFNSPADINGTGFLIIEHSGYEAEQSLYLPALRRSRRIASSQKSHRFVNSDFSYEDMERQSVDKFTYEIKGEKMYSNLECYELETRPKKDTISQYSLTRSLVTKDTFVPLFVEYFDKKGTHIKTYEVAKLESIQNIWTETLISMKDLVNDHTTYIKVNRIEYNTKVSADEITKSALENF